MVSRDGEYARLEIFVARSFIGRLSNTERQKILFELHAHEVSYDVGNTQVRAS